MVAFGLRKRKLSWLPPVCLLVALTHFGRFSCKHFRSISPGDIPGSLVPNHVRAEDSCSLNIKELGRVDPEVGSSDYDVEEFAQVHRIKEGGSWSPSHCRSVHTSLLVIPYRDRPEQLTTFLRHIHPFLQLQNVSYGILVVEQTKGAPFNRAKLFNVGFKEGQALVPSADCLIFHDVDLLPLDARNVYGCTQEPRHLTVSLDKFRFNLPYEGLFGGAVAVLASVFQAVNGMSNEFYGWGGEDDDFKENRLSPHGFDITRFSPEVGTYQMIRHIQETPSDERFTKLRSGSSEDGLSTLRYKRLSLKQEALFTHIVVDI